MGNSLKPCTNPASTDLPLTPDISFVEPSSINEDQLFVEPSIKIDIDEIIASRKELEQQKMEKDKTDELYKDVPLTKEFLQQNIASQNDFEFRLPASQFLSPDIYGFPVLKINLLDYCLKNNKYISSVKVNIVSKNSDIDNQIIDKILQNACYNLTFDIYNLIFYGDFVQNENLLLSNNPENYIVLPEIIGKQYHYANINILNIKDLLPILDDLEIQMLVSEVNFNEYAEGRINYKSMFEQYYERKDGNVETWNKLNICTTSGCTCVGYCLNRRIKKEETKE